MRKIELTQNKYAIVDDGDYDYLNQWKWYCSKDNYAQRIDNKLNKTILMHRVIMNPPSHLHIDHINRNGLNNQKENLRVCTRTQNNGNRRISKHNTSNIKGVSWHKTSKKWRGTICIKNKNIHLGYFSNKYDAKDAHEKEAKEYFGEFIQMAYENK